MPYEARPPKPTPSYAKRPLNGRAQEDRRTLDIIIHPPKREPTLLDHMVELGWARADGMLTNEGINAVMARGLSATAVERHLQRGGER